VDDKDKEFYRTVWIDNWEESFNVVKGSKEVGTQLLHDSIKRIRKEEKRNDTSL